MLSRSRVASAVLVIALVTASAAFAQSSLGIGTNEVAIDPSNAGWFAELFTWINVQQKAFYRAMTVALKGMRDDGNAAWLLVGLSFAYGIFHAAGPGHGKAVISSYMLANETTLKRGIFLSFVSAALQALSAVVIVGAAFLVLRGTAWSMDDATRLFEIASFALITAFGAWLLWSKIFRSGKLTQPDVCPPARPGLKYRGKTVTSPQVCQTCGNSHAPDPRLLGGNFNLKTAWSAVLAVGLRPCTGALIVLTFAVLNGLYLGGVLSVLAMALGTAITVSALAILAVAAKDLALRYSKPSAADTVMRVIEITGAALVFLFGLLLLGASLSA